MTTQELEHLKHIVSLSNDANVNLSRSLVIHLIDELLNRRNAWGKLPTIADYTDLEDKDD
jgi:hypothetical protein